MIVNKWHYTGFPAPCKPTGRKKLQFGYRIARSLPCGVSRPQAQKNHNCFSRRRAPGRLLLPLRGISPSVRREKHFRAPAGAQRSGSGGKRRSNGVSELPPAGRKRRIRSLLRRRSGVSKQPPWRLTEAQSAVRPPAKAAKALWRKSKQVRLCRTCFEVLYWMTSRCPSALKRTGTISLWVLAAMSSMRSLEG